MLSLTLFFLYSNDSVDCAVCNSTYHMSCVRPVLTRKPQRGFAWACAACSRAQERKMEARQASSTGTAQPEVEEENVEEEEEEANRAAGESSGDNTAPEDVLPQPATAEQIAQARMWPYRYLGIHCRVEDVLDYDDRIYPRASSRLGARHQANVNVWFGRPVEYVKPLDVKKKYLRPGSKRDSKLPKEAQIAVEAARQEMAKRPKWVMDEPVGFVHRGEDEPVMIDGKPTHTSELLWKMPTPSQLPARGEDDAPGAHLSTEDREKFVDEYMDRAKEMATEKGVEKYSTNFLDKALQLLYSEGFNVEAALAKLETVDKYSDLKEPHLLPGEIKMFEDGVSKYGSELRLVTKHVGSVPHYQVVRFYYMWKKTPRGRQIWGNYQGRRGKRDTKRNSPGKAVEDVADDQDDSAFDNDKITRKKCDFTCKFCSTTSSRQWRRAPGVQLNETTSSADNHSSKKDKGPSAFLALCLRCALLWRKYGIQWENVDEIARKITQSTHKSSRRRVDEEMLVQILVSTETPINISSSTAATAASLGVNVNANATANVNTQAQQGTAAASKKKSKPTETKETKSTEAKATEKDSTPATASSATPAEPAPKKKPAAEKEAEPIAAEAAPKKKHAPEKPKAPEQPLVPEPPRAKTLPCAVCNRVEPYNNEHMSCRDCRLTVHRSCYGISPSHATKWVCDMCLNDRNMKFSTCYECVLCPVTWTKHDLMEAPRISHKKKSDREREKERLEKEMVAEAIKLYHERQEAVGKPASPREPLKRTEGNNWVHVLCALWVPEIKFGDAKKLEPAEGFGLIPAERFEDVCKICKMSNKGACVSCHSSGCHAKFHVGCAFQARYRFGFDVSPIKNSRRDSANVAKIGDDSGVVSPAIWCPHHAIPNTVHGIGEPSTSKNGLSALQVYAQTYKQADLALTGTIRKAAHVQQVVEAHGGPERSRVALSTDGAADPMMIDSEPTIGQQQLDQSVVSESLSEPAQERKCCRCSAAFSPRWWPAESGGRSAKNGSTVMNGGITSNGSYHDNDKEDAVVCHKCHLKGSVRRPSAFSAQRPVLPAPAPRFVDNHSQANGSHSHPVHDILPRPPIGTPSSQHRPLAVPAHPAHPAHPTHPEWYVAYDHYRPPDYMDGPLRNGVPPAYHASTSHFYPAPPHFASAAPAPPPSAPPPAPPPAPPTSIPLQAYPTYQSPYAPVPVPQPIHHHPPPPPPPFAPVSPPNIHGGIVQHSSQFPVSRGYPVDRVLAAPSPYVEPRGPPQTLVRVEDRAIGGTPRPVANGSHAVNGTSGGSSSNNNGASGASASPSLKNLLS